MISQSIINYAKKALIDELYATAIYSKLSKYYEGKDLSRKFKELAEIERRHAKFWMEFLMEREVSLEGIRVSGFKVSLWVFLFKILGLGLTFKILEASERKAIEMYSKLLLESEELSTDEKEVLKKVLEDELIHEHVFAEEESRFKEFIDHVRDAVLGMNDGLVEVLSVSAGLAGAYGDPLYVALGGLIVGGPYPWVLEPLLA